MAKRKNSDLARLRNQVLQKQKNATRKANRIQNEQGIRVTNSRYDPRVPNERVSKLNTQQLNNLGNRLDQFTSRRTQFVKGHNSTPISRDSWNEYQGLQRQVNDRIVSERIALGAVMLPGSNQSIGERAQMFFRPNSSGGENSLDPYSRKTTGITSQKAMNTLIRDMRKRVDPNFESRLDQKRRKNFRKMLGQFNRPDIARELRKLTPQEFRILWENDRVIQDLAEEYTIAKDLMTDDDNAIERDSEPILDDIKANIISARGDDSIRGGLQRANAANKAGNALQKGKRRRQKKR